ncbi:MAG: 3-deoxy-D-manno-octulosonate 8-phosphate phosphatase [Candidatus Jettenia sp.]|uniref:3-deoxy-D-manno-octulosonate 8-phosphate phosphatase n=1 Tax=Candidatus Jettenia caeni TaxID=247490 RepID=I3IID2_9BACT|nr:HAD hydrolase family protein [Candidatus Jettenia sp. AMX1]MBC6928286.1 3-deoxy-D-manno-octulosonate 8-phosphate phosphatase [Candidatus Jettenia sp.]NUN23080.1 HAD hydrolase family protein [Candidatus Jettenia caeni]KAA0249953.1 MAG: 3-deoxy-D-manno-octulosonate 8-phosphate phosphatase [Candidatus Jettenia sp. AMX1]MCE7880432.1 3-deoxy-D-manno-octulosonate 8-phosphate phosphatase [Candidatus Jettenia sp. AMX1]MCQ3926240.1 3-deoxy-D-manno-octulosonate 8-phosphate phosphatase [Candidatus Jet
MDFKSAVKNIKLVIIDVDGVLTDGSIYIDVNGYETKAFHVLDGTGISYLHRVGIKTAIISGRTSKAVIHRAKELSIEDVYQGFKNKLEAYKAIQEKYAFRDEEICYIGDDLIDLPIFYRVGLPVAVANASPIVKQQSLYVTKAKGGTGAVREVAEKIIKFQDKWHIIMERYQNPPG